MQNGLPDIFSWGKASIQAETFEYLNYFHYLGKGHQQLCTIK
jgi:hypothetical protein